MAATGARRGSRACASVFRQAIFFDDLEPGVASGIGGLLSLLTERSARLGPLALPRVEIAAEANAIFQNTEAALTNRPFWNDERLSPGIRERIELGRSIGEEERRRVANVAGS